MFCLAVLWCTYWYSTFVRRGGKIQRGYLPAPSRFEKSRERSRVEQEVASYGIVRSSSS